MLNRNIRPVRHITAVTKGVSRPQLILFSDGRKYIVKFKNNKQGTRALVNEYVAGRLAQFLRLPVPRFKVVYVPNTFIRVNPVLSQHNFAPGHQFASEYIPNCVQNIKLLRRKPDIKNRDQLAGMIVFDQWISNVDRIDMNILFKPVPRGGYKVYLIDYGNSFSLKRTYNHWTQRTLKLLPQKHKPNVVYNLCSKQVRSPAYFSFYVQKIKQLSNRQIYKVIQSIPDDWNVSQVEKRALFAYLIKSKRMLPNLTKQFIYETYLKRIR